MTGPPTLSLVALDGTVLVGSIEPEGLSDRAYPAAGVTRGVVFQATRGLDLWDASTGEAMGVRVSGEKLGAPTGGSGFVSDAHGSKVLWCVELCLRMLITDTDLLIGGQFPDEGEAPIMSTLSPRKDDVTFEGHSARFSADGRQVAATSYTEPSDVNQLGVTTLWIGAAETGYLRAVATFEGRSTAPAWRPDGTKIFLSSGDWSVGETRLLLHDLTDGSTSRARLPIGSVGSILAVSPSEMGTLLTTAVDPPCPLDGTDAYTWRNCSGTLSTSADVLPEGEELALRRRDDGPSE